jgi:hypothetical protein
MLLLLLLLLLPRPRQPHPVVMEDAFQPAFHPKHHQHSFVVIAPPLALCV